MAVAKRGRLDRRSKHLQDGVGVASLPGRRLLQEGGREIARHWGEHGTRRQRGEMLRDRIHDTVATRLISSGDQVQRSSSAVIGSFLIRGILMPTLAEWSIQAATLPPQPEQGIAVPRQREADGFGTVTFAAPWPLATSTTRI